MKRKANTEKQLAGTARPDRAMGLDKVPILEELEQPAPELWGAMSTRSQKLYEYMGAEILTTGKLTRLDLPALVAMATALDRMVWAMAEVNRKNKRKMGTGFIQRYKTGATNITTELSVYQNALREFNESSKQFGLNFADRFKLQGFLGESGDPAQTSLLDLLNEGEHLKVVGENG